MQLSQQENKTTQSQSDKNDKSTTQQKYPSPNQAMIHQEKDVYKFSTDPRQMKIGHKLLKEIITQNYDIEVIQIIDFPGGWQAKCYKIITKDQMYVFKIQAELTWELTIGIQHYKIQDDMLLYLEEFNKGKGKDQIKNLYPKIVAQKNNNQTTLKIKIDQHNFYIRMMYFIDEPVEQMNNLPGKARKIGQRSGILDKDLEGFKKDKEHQVKQQKYEEFVEQWPILKQIVQQQYTHNQPRKTDILQKIDQFFLSYKYFFLRILPKLPIQTIHYDIHPGNLLKDKQDKQITGIIDFGWTIRTTLRINQIIYPLTFAICFWQDQKQQFRNIKSVLQTITQIFGGYNSTNPFTDLQIQCFFLALVAKMSIRFIQCKWDKGNIQKLMRLLDLGEEAVKKSLIEVCSKK